ncbi:hypothetical protein N7516_009271 [Penicillium verrucosum]|uniref:uncharacterized protein n=1 Tax=Penicillium verrucosum TaxID=60171 RepID=UPI002545853F|nr:uncharacterized protein N7516_009271 [Penicillium verrucosum]KAJ5927498.1 hypothetical protein N7516_009271 [Penicillium verrucosum]
MTEGHRPRQGQHGPQMAMVGHQNQLSAGLSMDTYSGPTIPQPTPCRSTLISGLILTQHPAPADNSSVSMQSYVTHHPVIQQVSSMVDFGGIKDISK